MSKPLNINKALEEIVPRLYRYAILLTNNSGDAEDLVQSTVDKALQKQAQWQEGSHLDRWVFTIQSSLWKNEIRWRSYRQHDDEKSFDDAISCQDNCTERTLLLSQVFKEVMALAEDQREAMLLVYVEGYKYNQAAEILDIPLGTLMSRLARARLILASKLNTDLSIK